MVRLGVPENPYSTEVTILFQFQHGAIGSLTGRAVFRTKTTVSIPAWCDWEDGVDMLANYRANRFNSSMVRLGDLGIHQDVCPASSFNSSMVRLGGVIQDT